MNFDTFKKAQKKDQYNQKSLKFYKNFNIVIKVKVISIANNKKRFLGKNQNKNHNFKNLSYIIYCNYNKKRY